MLKLLGCAILLAAMCATVPASGQPVHEEMPGPGGSREAAIAAVWATVEARNATWTADDFEGHMALYHPDFRRWANGDSHLVTRESFAEVWDDIKANEHTLSIDVEPEEVVFLTGDAVAIAHYTITEVYEPISEQAVAQRTVRLRFSDVYVNEDGRWLYAGGHKDHMGLRETPPQAADPAADVEFRTGVLGEAGLPFSEAVRVGDLFFLSGQIGNRPGTLELVESGIGPETRQMMENIGATLTTNGLDFSNIVRCTVMLDDMADWPAFNEVYRSYFTAPYPARSAFGADGLALGARVEMECIAAR